MKEELEKLFRDTAFGLTAPIGIGFFDPESGIEVYHNADMRFPTASIYKTFVLAELFNKESKGLFDFSGKHIILESEKSPGSGIIKNEEAGKEYSMSELCDLMMQVSDNTAADFLTARAGLSDIRKDIIEPLGLVNTKIDLDCTGLLSAAYNVDAGTLRDMAKRKAIGAAMIYDPYFNCEIEKNDESTPRDMIKLFSAVYYGTLPGKETGKRMVEIMLGCKTNDRIPALLPENVKVAHKTGTVSRQANDAGIVYTEKGAYIIAFFYKGNFASKDVLCDKEWKKHQNEMLARLSRSVYDIYMAG